MKAKSLYATIIVSGLFLIGLQPAAYSTIYLDNSGWHDDYGSDPGIGTWDSVTLTGTLITDLDDPVHKNIQIDDSGITLDGANHTVHTALFSYGIHSSNTTGITIKNLTTENAHAGISLYNCSNSTITGNTLLNGYKGIELGGSENITVEENLLSSNDIGIYLYASSYNTIRYNEILNENNYGLFMISSNNNVIINNNFVNNPTQAINYYGTDNIWNLAAPIGGNYWNDWTVPPRTDTDNDGFVDQAYSFAGGTDYLPLVNPFTPGPCDTTPPTTAISLSGTVGNNGWYVSDVEIALAATDDDSGVASTEFSFGEMSRNTYSAPFTITSEGTTTIYYRSTDNAGNVEGTRIETIGIDKSPPDRTVICPTAYGLYEIGMTLDFSAYDSLSGLSQLWGTLTDADEEPQSVNSGYEPYVGVYELAIMAADEAGNYAESDPVFFVVYDPEGGFVTGGGWIYSEPGAYKPDLTLEGRATFGFVSKYKKGMTVPTGNTEFVFQTGDLNFHSSSYDWLVVTGSNYARFKGMGTMNGSGEYKFQIWAGDNAPDTFRIKIWTESTVGEVVVEDVVYDNGFDQAIEAGSIVVHTK